MKKLLVPINREKFPLAGGEGGYFVVNSPAADGRVINVAGGFCSVPYRYFKMADELACLGWTVVIPDLSRPLQGENPETPVVNKCNRIRMALEDLGTRLPIEGFRSAGHSYGGPAEAGLIDDAPYELHGLDFINALGHGKMDDSAVEALKQAVGFCLHEGKSIVTAPLDFMGLKALRAHVSVLADRTNRRHELQEIRAMDDFIVPYVERAKKAGVPVRFFVSVHDHVVRPGPTIEAVGASNVFSIHENANHFAPNTHGRHVAHLLTA